MITILTTSVVVVSYPHKSETDIQMKIHWNRESNFLMKIIKNIPFISPLSKGVEITQTHSKIEGN